MTQEPPKRKRGRPAGRHYEHVLFVRLTDEDKRMLLALAEERHTTNFSAAARSAIRHCYETTIRKGDAA